MKKLFIPILIIFIGSCSISDLTLENKKLYQKAIADAAYVQKTEIYNHLTTINKENKNLVWKTINNENYILAVTWKTAVDYYKPYLDSANYNVGNYPIWVTIVPDLLNFMQNDKSKDKTARLKQLLGLTPTGEYKYFIEFWVKPEDLFRPCPDKEITDSACQTCFPPSVDSEHKQWINNLRAESYSACDLYNQYPWTQLGYTYDWNKKSKTHVGLSEFVISKNSKIIVKQIYTTQEYMEQK